MVACCNGYCGQQCLAQLAPTSQGLSISYYVQRLTLHWIICSTFLMMPHKAETVVQGWSADPIEDVILTHARTHARTHTYTHTRASLLFCVCLLSWLLHKLVLLSCSACTHKQGAEHKPLCSEVDSALDHTQHPAGDGPQG